MASFYNEQVLKLDLKQQQPNAIPRFVQYDSATLKIELYDNGKKYDVSKAEEFVISIKRPDGEMLSGLAKYEDGFIVYSLTKQDLDQLGEVQARLQVYEGRKRISSLSFRYDVYEDYETVGSAEEQTLLSQLFTRLHDALTEAQRQGNYAENRGDYANSSGDYAMDAGNSQKMRWLMYVNTLAERNTKYPNPLNGDVVYVVNVDGMAGGAVYRYNSIQQPASWELISGYDTSIVQDIYNILSTKESKEEVRRITDALNKRLDDLTIGGRNYFSNTLNVYDTTGTYGYRKVSDDNTPKVVTIKDRDTSVDISNIYFGFTKSGIDASGGVRWEILKGVRERELDADESLKGFNYISFLPKTQATLDKLSRRFYIKVENGTKPSDWSPAPEDLVKYTDINADNDSINFGHVEIGGDKVAQTIVGKAGALDLLGNNIDLSKNTKADTLIRSTSLDNTYKNIGGIRNAILTPDSVTSPTIKVDTPLLDKLLNNAAFKIQESHIEQLSFDKIKGGTATFGGSGENGMFQILDINDNAIMKADYEQAAMSEIAVGTLTAENIISDRVVSRMSLPREYIINKTKYGYLEEAVTLSEVNANLAIGNTRERVFTGTTSYSLTHTYNLQNTSETLLEGEKYTISFDISNISGANSGFIDIRPHSSSQETVTIDIRTGKGKATWTQPVNSDQILIYRDIVGQSRHDISFTLSNIKIESGDVATTYIEQITDKESSDTVEVWYAGSIQQAVDSIPTYVDNYVHLFIDTITDDDRVVLEGKMGTGWIRFYYNIKKNYNSFYFNNKIRVDVYGGGTDFAYNTGLFPYSGRSVIEYHKNDYSIVKNINMHGDGGQRDGISVRQGSSVLARDCNFYNVEYGLYVTENSQATAIKVAGTAEQYGWYVNWGSSIWGSGTVRPMGKLGSRRLVNGGRDMTDFTVESPPKVTNPPKVVVPKRVTKKWSTTAARTTYRSRPTNFTITFMRDFPIQGQWPDAWGQRDGAWYFGSNMRSTLKGKKIIRVRVSVGRSAYNSQGWVGRRKFTLKMHNYASKPAANKNPTLKYGSASYSGYLALGERKWFDVTSTFKSEIASGRFAGFGVTTNSTSKYEYMAMAKSLTVEVTYEE